MVCIGIDPGAQGAIAVITMYTAESGLKSLDPVTLAMPRTEREIYEFLHTYTGRGDARALLERAQATPQMGRSSAFNYGVGYGGLRMALAAAAIPYDLIPSGRWQQALQCQSAGDKNVTKRRAQELFPTLTITHKIADALLMAEYLRRLRSGELQHLPAATKAAKTHRLTTRKHGDPQPEEPDESPGVDPPDRS